MINIIVADAHPILVTGLKTLLKNETKFQIKGTAHNEAELFQILQHQQADLVLIDISTLSPNGIRLLDKLKKDYPQLKQLVFTNYTDQSFIKKVLKSGVDGYILKCITKKELLHAMDTIVRGQTYFAQTVKEILMNSYYKKHKVYQAPLTNREKEITTLIANGMNTPEIAGQLYISPLTVETHRKNIFTKLGISKVTALVRYAVQEGLVE